MYKDNAVGNVVAETGKDFVFMFTAWPSDFSMPLKGEVKRSREQSARQPIGAAVVQRAYSRRGLDCEKTTVLCFLPSWSTLLFARGLGEEGGFDVASRNDTPKTSWQDHKQQLFRPRSGPSKAAHTRTTLVKAQQVLSKRNPISTKNYWKAKTRSCVKLFEVTNTAWEYLQIAKHKSVQCAEWMTLNCALRFAVFLGLCLSPQTTSRTISFSLSKSFWY